MELHIVANRPHLVDLFEQFIYDVPDAFLLAFSVRDVLMLRILGLASDVVILPYDYFQNLSPFAAQIIAHSARGALARKLGISVRTISL
jgi:hypothetical protein